MELKIEIPDNVIQALKGEFTECISDEMIAEGLILGIYRNFHDLHNDIPVVLEWLRKTKHVERSADILNVLLKIYNK